MVDTCIICMIHHNFVSSLAHLEVQPSSGHGCVELHCLLVYRGLVGCSSLLISGRVQANLQGHGKSAWVYRKRTTPCFSLALTSAPCKPAVVDVQQIAVKDSH